MINVSKTSTIAIGISAFLLMLSTAGMAEYTQKQNKVDDKAPSQSSQPNHSSSDNKTNDSARKKSSSDHHDTSTDNRSGTNPSVPSGSDKKGGY